MTHLSPRHTLAVAIAIPFLALDSPVRAQLEDAHATAWEFTLEQPESETMADRGPEGGMSVLDFPPPSNWFDLRNSALQNDLRAICRASGTDFVCAVGAGAISASGNPEGHGPLICRSWDRGKTWTITQPTVNLGPLPSSFCHFIAVNFVSPLQGWAVGTIGQSEAAVIYHTSDGGESWQLQYETAASPPGHLAFLDVCFADSLRGWAVGAIDPGSNIAIVATVDGGMSWQTQTTGINALVSQVDFLDASVGFALANLGYTLGTVDGGATWTIIGQNSAYSQSWGIDFLDAERGFCAIGPGGIEATLDGGQTWATVYNQAGWEFDVQFADSLNGWMVGDVGATAQTMDGGLTWEARSPAFHQPLLGCVPLDDSTVCAAGDVGMITRTEDAGQIWKQVDGDGYLSATVFRGADFVSEDLGWIVGNFGEALRTEDGGATWTRLDLGTNAWLSDLSFPTATDGWICGGQSIWRSVDAGDHWDLVHVAPTSVGAIFALDSQTAWACGTGGAIYRTVDGGQTWEMPSSGTVEGLYGIHFASEESGWVVGWSGTILHTMNGGQSWTPQASGIASPIYSVTFADEQNGWAAAIDAILRTTDGGANWTYQLFPPTQIRGISFADPLHGCVVGGVVGEDFVACTNDGGQNWIFSNVVSPQNKLMQVALASPTVGYAVGYDGKVLKSTDLPLSPLIAAPPPSRSGTFGINWIVPNPNRGRFAVSMSFPSQEPASVDIYDAAGRRVRSRRVAQPQLEAQVVEFGAEGSLSPGVYFIRVEQQGRTVAEKTCIVK